MNIKMKFSFILMVIFMFNNQIIHAQTPTSGKSYYTIEKEIDKLVRQTMGRKVPGMTVAVSHKGRLVFSKGYGYANHEKKTKMKRTHRSKIGSVSKIITALGIMKLSEEKSNFNLNSKLYFSSGVLNSPLYTNAIKKGAKKTNTPLNWYKQMEVRHLLSHTVGYGWSSANKQKMAAYFGISESQISIDQYRAYFLATKKVDNAPGTRYDYSNYAVGTCGNIIKKMTGKSYARYIDTKIFKPLGLNGKIVPNNHKRDKYDSFPHSYKDGKITTLSWPSTTKNLDDNISAAGSWSASAQSLIRIMVATDKLSNHSDILKPATINLMEKRPFPNASGSHAIGWGYGSGGKKLSHNGSIGGGRALIVKFKPGFKTSDGIDLSDINIAICANVQIGEGQKELANKIAKIVAKANIPSSYDLFEEVSGQYVGVWRAKNTNNKFWVGANWSTFNKKWKEFGDKGYRLIDIDTYKKNGKRLYNGVWEKRNEKYALYQIDSWAKFTKKWDELSKKGQRLIDVETFKSGNKRYYIGVFLAGSGKHHFLKLDSWDKLTKKWDELSKKGQRLIDLETFDAGGQRHYLAVFRSGKGGYALYGINNWDKFNSKWKQLNSQGHRLMDFETYKANGKRHYVGVFKTGKNNAFYYNMDWNHFKARNQELAKEGKCLIDLEKI